MPRARSVATLVLVAACVAPATAAAHHEDGQLTAAQRHMAADLAGVSVQTLERRVNRIARRLGYRPGARLKSGGRLAAVGDPGTVGSWSGVIAAPVVPIFSALLPSGRILMWDSVGDDPAESYTTHNFTRAAVYDPVANTSKNVNVSGYNISAPASCSSRTATSSSLAATSTAGSTAFARRTCSIGARRRGRAVPICRTGAGIRRWRRCRTMRR